MAYVESILQPGERVVCRARVHWAGYIYAVLWLGLVMMPGKLTGLMSTELALTDKRVIGKVGMFRTRHLAWPHSAIAIVRVRQGLAGKLLDYGTLTLVDKHDRRMVFKGIDCPLDLQWQIEEAVEVAVLGHRLQDIS